MSMGNLSVRIAWFARAHKENQVSRGSDESNPKKMALFPTRYWLVGSIGANQRVCALQLQRSGVGASAPDLQGESTVELIRAWYVEGGAHRSRA